MRPSVTVPLHIEDAAHQIMTETLINQTAQNNKEKQQRYNL